MHRFLPAQFGAEFVTREDSEVRGRKFLQANYAINIDLVVVGNRDSDYAVSLEPIFYDYRNGAVTDQMMVDGLKANGIVLSRLPTTTRSMLIA